MLTQDYLTISPAYGRDYKDASPPDLDSSTAFDDTSDSTAPPSLLKDWFDGKDFRMESVASGCAGRYCSRRDFASGTRVQIRYARKTRVAIVTA